MAVSPKHKLVGRVSGDSWCIMVQALDIRQGIVPVQGRAGRYPAQPILELFPCPLRRTTFLMLVSMAVGPPDPEQGADSLPQGAHKLWSIVRGDQRVDSKHLDPLREHPFGCFGARLP